MDSVDSVADKLKKQNLGNDGSNSRRMLKLEELNWDHSFVRELPADPRTDTIPREVFSFVASFLFLVSICVCVCVSVFLCVCVVLKLGFK